MDQSTDNGRFMNSEDHYDVLAGIESHDGGQSLDFTALPSHYPDLTSDNALSGVPGGGGLGATMIYDLWLSNGLQVPAGSAPALGMVPPTLSQRTESTARYLNDFTLAMTQGSSFNPISSTSQSGISRSAGSQVPYLHHGHESRPVTLNGSYSTYPSVRQHALPRQVDNFGGSTGSYQYPEFTGQSIGSFGTVAPPSLVDTNTTPEVPQPPPSTRKRAREESHRPSRQPPQEPYTAPLANTQRGSTYEAFDIPYEYCPLYVHKPIYFKTCKTQRKEFSHVVTHLVDKHGFIRGQGPSISYLAKCNSHNPTQKGTTRCPDQRCNDVATWTDSELNDPRHEGPSVCLRCYAVFYHKRDLKEHITMEKPCSNFSRLEPWNKAMACYLAFCSSTEPPQWMPDPRPPVSGGFRDRALRAEDSRSSVSGGTQTNRSTTSRRLQRLLPRTERAESPAQVSPPTSGAGLGQSSLAFQDQTLLGSGSGFDQGMYLDQNGILPNLEDTDLVGLCLAGGFEQPY